MSFEKAMSKMKFDIRLLEYNLEHGFITKGDHDKFLGQLDDCAHLIAAPASAEPAASDAEDAEDESH